MIADIQLSSKHGHRHQDTMPDIFFIINMLPSSFCDSVYDRFYNDHISDGEHHAFRFFCFLDYCFVIRTDCDLFYDNKR